MSYTSIKDCIKDLETTDQLVRIKSEVDPYLVMAEVQRRAYLNQAPAILFENVKGSKFPAVSNLFGTMDRAQYIFRDTLELVSMAVQMKADPVDFAKHYIKKLALNPAKLFKFATVGMSSLPKKVSSAPVMQNTCRVEDLPQVHCWPKDGGSFITLPQVFSMDDSQKIMKANLGMYRVQLSGNEYIQNQEVGMHYQIHRGLGIHHQEALRKNKPLQVSIFVGGPPAHTLAAVMPMPEGLSELLFAGMLAGRRFRYHENQGSIVSAEADFCITGEIEDQLKPEGPFGDHLGYYSLDHPFPVMKVNQVYHREEAIWPFTVVGRPPQEDTVFGQLIHSITSSMVPVSISGVHELHAVDAAGVHPLLLAKGSERYTPYKKNNMKPQELLTQANAILGFNQCSLAKYLFIVAKEDSAGLDIHDVESFFEYVLKRVDWQRDLHFQTRTTMDTLDYSSEGLNEGSKVVVPAYGEVKLSLCKELPRSLSGRSLPSVNKIKLAMQGVLLFEMPSFNNYDSEKHLVENLEKQLEHVDMPDVALIILCDDADFCSDTFNNFLWTCFTSSNPSHDIYGVGSFTKFKHWGCTGPLIIDARHKPHMAPPLHEDPDTVQKVEELMISEPNLKSILS